MKRLNNIITAILVGLMLTGCGLYNKYEQTVQAPAEVFGTTADVVSMAGDTTTIARMTWREFFTDPLLRQLIEQVLVNNTDLNSARITVEKSEAALTAARQAYLPAISFAPQGALSSFDGNTSKTYSLPLQLSMDIDLFGTITNKKRAAEAVRMQAQMQHASIRANLISLTAQHYFMLQVLDRQLEILTQTDSLWNKSLQIEHALWENGKAFSTAVNQMEASYLTVKTQIADVRRKVRSVENALCQLLAIPPQHINRSKWGSSPLHLANAEQPLFDTKYLHIGVPAAMLEMRPDIRMANYAMAEAFYNTQGARAAFYPGLTLNGTIGWTNDAGVIVNPGKLLFSLIGQLTQPIFARGKLKANKRIAELTEEDLQRQYVQIVINAGNQVNEAMADCMTAREKHEYYRRQVEVLQEAYFGTHELMENGKASYLEVLKAQETLLEAQLATAMNMYQATDAVVALYIALGGGAE